METKQFLEIIGGSIEKANDLMRRYKVLRFVYMFNTLDSKCLKKLALLLEVNDYEKDEVVFNKGDASDKL